MDIKFRLLKASEIDARVSTVSAKGCSLLLYKDARVDQRLLDETVGALNWKRSHQLIGDRLYCTVEIWDDEKKEWVSKQDVGTESYTEKEKGQASDSFKRACFNFGIGRELYTAPFIWIGADKCDLTDGANGKKTTYDRFKVKSIGYDSEGNINQLTIINEKRKGAVVYTYGGTMGEVEVEPETTTAKGTDKITATHIEALKKRYPKEEQVKNIFDHFKIGRWEDMTITQLNELIGGK